MKRTLSIAVSLLALCAFAQEVEEPVDPPEVDPSSEEPSEPSTPQNVSSVPSTNVFGVVKVSGSCRRYILPTPWCDFQPGVDAPIVASNLLKTANLDVGDMLHLFDESGNVYNSWELDEADGVKYWRAVQQVAEMGTSETSPEASSKTSAQGSSFMLIRPEKSSTGTGEVSYFFLFGQVGHKATVAAVTIPAGGTTETPIYRLISCPKVNSDGFWSLNDSNDVVFESGDYTGDMIRIAQSNGIIFDYYWCNNAGDCDSQALKVGMNKGTFSEPGWYVRQTTVVQRSGKAPLIKTSFSLAESKIKCGFGGWYVSSSNARREITWQNVPKQP